MPLLEFSLQSVQRNNDVISEFAFLQEEKGLGLGLHLVHEFIQINNGQIKVESEPGIGTTFTVELPVFSSEIYSERVP